MKQNELAFKNKNYLVIFIGVLLVILGYIFMIGGKAENPEIFNGKELFNFRRITLSTITVLLGFVFVGFGIIKRFDNENE